MYTRTLTPFENKVLLCQGRMSYMKFCLLLLLHQWFQKLGSYAPNFYLPIYQWQGRLVILSQSLTVFLFFRKCLNIYI